MELVIASGVMVLAVCLRYIIEKKLERRVIEAEIMSIAGSIIKYSPDRKAGDWIKALVDAEDEWMELQIKANKARRHLELFQIIIRPSCWIQKLFS